MKKLTFPTSAACILSFFFSAFLPSCVSFLLFLSFELQTAADKFLEFGDEGEATEPRKMVRDCLLAWEDPVGRGRSGEGPSWGAEEADFQKSREKRSARHRKRRRAEVLSGMCDRRCLWHGAGRGELLKPVILVPDGLMQKLDREDCDWSREETAPQAWECEVWRLGRHWAEAC